MMVWAANNVAAIFGAQSNKRLDHSNHLDHHECQPPSGAPSGRGWFRLTAAVVSELAVAEAHGDWISFCCLADCINTTPIDNSGEVMSQGATGTVHGRASGRWQSLEPPRLILITVVQDFYRVPMKQRRSPC